MLRVFRSRFPGSDIARLTRITRILFASGSDLIAAHIPDGDLRLIDVDWFETQMEIGVTNVRLLKQFSAA